MFADMGTYKCNSKAYKRNMIRIAQNKDTCVWATKP